MQRIEESELIINSRGAIYHLDLRPDELSHKIFLVGDPGRVPVVSKYFDRIEIKQQHREFVSHTGLIGSERYTVVSTGIGTDNIDIVMNELDALVNIDFATRTIKPNLTQLQIIRLGTSGSLQREIPVDSFVASTHGLGIDNLTEFLSSGTKRSGTGNSAGIHDPYTIASTDCAARHCIGIRIFAETFYKWISYRNYDHLSGFLWSTGKNIKAWVKTSRTH